jgi:hypothetical protein
LHFLDIYSRICSNFNVDGMQRITATFLDPRELLGRFQA